MFLKISICSIILFFSLPSVFAERSLVEDIFSDIDEDYQYRDELQTLYDRGMIIPGEDNLFWADKPLQRDEFVGISMEVVCERCMLPHTDFSYIEKYTQREIYFDVTPENPYFYCIAEADTNNAVRGYGIGESCQNGQSNPLERPFCPENTIKLEEAVAVLLRNSWIFTIEQNQEVIRDISAGRITEKLWNDVSPTDMQWNPYTFYGYLRKALEYEIYEYDSSGNKKILKLLGPDSWGNINAQSFVSKEDFLRMAYIALKSNNCKEVTDEALALQIRIQDKQCKISDGINCRLSSLDDAGNIYDFVADGETTCELGIDKKVWYIWRFHNTDTGQQIFRYTPYLDNFIFPWEGTWRVYSRVVDICGNSSEVYSTVVTRDVGESWLSVSVNASPIAWYESLFVEFTPRVKWWQAPYEYEWNFWQGAQAIWSKVSYLYRNEGIYRVLLQVRDRDGKTSSSTAVIEVYDWDVCGWDSDSDGINDCDDRCPWVFWTLNNSGCPVYESSCWPNCSCPEGYICSSSDETSCSQDWVCQPITFRSQNCLHNNQSASILWGAVCDSCPCDQSVDFYASMRSCDVIFPAITSPDGSQLYSRGNYWQVE